MYENFVLELEWRHLKPMGNAGVFIWADALPARASRSCARSRCRCSTAATPRPTPATATCSPSTARAMTPDRPHPKGRCAACRASAAQAGRRVESLPHHCKNGTLKLAVNGKEVSGGYDISPRKGYIGLESEGAPTLFRNIRIRELPSAGTLPPAHRARPTTATRRCTTARSHGADRPATAPCLEVERLDDHARGRRRGQAALLCATPMGMSR